MRAGEPIPPEALLAAYPDPIADLAEQVRLVVRLAVPDAIEAVRPGWRVIGYNLPIGRRAPFFAWIMAEIEHVHLGFPQGILLADPGSRLDGNGITKRARWLTVQPGQVLDTKVFGWYAAEGARLARLSPSEHHAILADRDLQVSSAKPR